MDADTLRIMEPSDRLRQAREKAGFPKATDAARAYGWNEITYTSHENGARGLRPDVAEKYAKALRTPVEWLLYGKTKAAPKAEGTVKTVPLVGHVGAGAEAHYYGSGDGEFDEVPAPEGATEASVAVEIRGESLGSFFDRWIVHYDDIRRPVTTDLIGQLCVVGTADGRVLIKKIKRSRAKGLFHLLSQTEVQAFDDAANHAERFSIMRGGQAGHLPETLRIIEKMRSMLVGEDKPRHGV